MINEESRQRMMYMAAMGTILNFLDSRKKCSIHGKKKKKDMLVGLSARQILIWEQRAKLHMKTALSSSPQRWDGEGTRWDGED